ncbi:hypothetical protein [Candidatus Amarobacter glycogenicus]|uniref:hypothetical protein n=1 Tax=Candidatus Amarobacter glycogenicus TaxID=3140699 RepID=UPI002A1746B6|nr:hypothetical protein [Dehalococcoidia bacterium]
MGGRGTHLDAAWVIAESADYPDCQTWICQLRGDLERLAAQPNSELVLRHYAEACAYAASFNARTLAQVLDYLVAVWSAHAEDGHPDETIWFCDSMIAIWEELGYAEPAPELPVAFGQLRARCAGRCEENEDD